MAPSRGAASPRFSFWASSPYAPFGAASIGGEACARTGRTDCTQYCD